MGGQHSPGIDVDLEASIVGGLNLNVSIPTSYFVNIDNVAPVDVSLRLKEIPSIRAHFSLG